VANPNPTYKIKPYNEEAMAKKTLATRVPVEIDDYVRSLPNKAEWLRQAIMEKIERELQQKNG
jgi:hypothetical protein